MLSPLPLLSAPPVAPTFAAPVSDAFRVWPHQARFRQATQVMADSLFGALDEDLEPYVLLLALPTLSGTVADVPTVCLEPAECGLESRLFEDAVAEGRRLQTRTVPPYPGRDDVSPELVRRRHEGQGVRMAVQTVLDTLDANSPYQHFCGWPSEINGFFVMTVLRVQRKPLRAYPSLRTGRFYTNGKPLLPSLLVASVLRFQEECIKLLNEPEPGSGLLARPRETEELLRAAGKSLLDTPAQALGTEPGAARLFHTLNTISSLRYEGAEGVGKLLLARRHHPNLQEVFALTCPTPLTDYRAVRKLLEMTTPDVSLLADGENVYALGRLVGPYDASREDLFVIEFINHYSWEFQHDGKVLMRTQYGQPSLPRPRLNRTKFRKDLKRTFQLTDPAKIERLWEVVLEASRQKHGTLLVITTEALAEADRLKLQCTLIEPVPLTPLITRLVTAIDGAVLLDPESYCYSIGVILDGKASMGRGTSTRGARYNSAIRYVETSPYPCLAIVVSEDGLVDVITKERLEDDN
ncbi:DNA integrity scanning protein DisA nucleotide-binding domain protein [Microvirga sp. STR05]|uniref:DNA integrity scanning protein DisA nucleotide-binding domain protein n=1 Tax=Hymenobacter duratus TaxID=2771356 RepID=A0ABR8JCI6_9BACT|nr:DNA integrity scanning protein DisA nucleotide-binding domain protein [Hymenobacter duratus]MBD2714501.1 DNA integrity scanning protein DisA nucleotide-binding domain protein [Hymenobacter duratus]MBR7949405.1 DNA integrity scanning protein DisA nucleotide-binding domain protein [Microvirga sp. STR05]